MSEYIVVQPTPDSEILASTGPAIPVEDFEKATGRKKYVGMDEVTEERFGDDSEDSKDEDAKEDDDKSESTFAKTSPKAPAKAKPVDGAPAK